MDNKKIECVICLDSKFFVSKTPCNHNVCIDCLFRLKKMECPYCRYDLEKTIPSIIKDHIVNKKQELKKHSNILLSDFYEFPPL